MTTSPTRTTPLSCILVSILFLEAAFGQEPGRPAIPEHTKDTLAVVRERVEQKKAILVDVRSDVEWNAGHVKGAVFLPWRDLQDKLDEKAVRAKLPKDRIVYTYCAVGYRAARAGAILAKLGYEVRPLKPGYEELIKAGFPSEKKVEPPAEG
jgi:rhodanese-related sulfurtransferase